MPVSLILYLDVPQSAPPDFLGREAQAWFLHTIHAMDPNLAHALHEGEGHKPYTVSDIFPLPVNWQAKSPGPFLIRFTALTETLETFLIDTFAANLPENVRLWDTYFPVRGFSYSSDECPWAGRYSYRWLAETAQEMSVEHDANRIPLEFISPTGFRSNGLDVADPVPALVFRGCYQKWNQFAPPEMHMHSNLPRFVQDCVTVQDSQDFARQRIVFAHGKRGGAVGFTGTVNFSILPPTSIRDWDEGMPGWAAQVRALAMYSFFCGVGHHTTVGLGQTFPRLQMPQG